ncbi:sensor histidine kinase [Streptococcus sp. S784/96/1]|uniref:sensor histidine kinase n=1 Tax=Streptococcus sp. S784/96/1 TaxID=2653499 RepID=UPI00138742B1|nr:sensor histidine kinase [Streptococcus sp. S784/96/1]
MMMKYIKQHGIWYLVISFLSVGFLVSFALYHLPMIYFGMTLLFNLIVLIPFSIWHFLSFRRQLRLLANFRDLWEIAELSSPLDESYQKALSAHNDKAQQEVFRAQSQASRQQDLIKMWVHQMKVPLSAVSLMAQTNQLQSDDVNQQVIRLEHYLENLLTYLKFSERQDDFRFEQISVNELIREVIKKNRILFFHKQLSVEVTGDWQLKTDKKWLSFALSQILDNAIKYSTAGGKITITLTENSITIADQGIGILPEDLPRLFEEGFTGYNGHEHQKASGFGLYMTKQVLNQLDLAIEVTSQIDIGTEVVVSKRKNEAF